MCAVDLTTPFLSLALQYVQPNEGPGQLVLANAMKRLFFTLMGAALFAIASYGLVELFALWYGPRYIKSDSDIGDAFMVVLGFMLACLIGGGMLGYRFARRSLRGT